MSSKLAVKMKNGVALFLYLRLKSFCTLANEPRACGCNAGCGLAESKLTHLICDAILHVMRLEAGDHQVIALATVICEAASRPRA
eukprot:6457419-Prymnesium_polylepis.1